MSEPNDNSQDLSPERAGDERLVHALLVHWHDDRTAQNRQRRVDRVLQAIESEREPGGRTLRLWAARAGWAAAAAGVVVALVWAFTASPTPAMASLDDILASLARPGDRTYYIAMEDQPAPPEPDRRPPRPDGRTPRPGLDGATLYLRDGRQYLLARKDPNGGRLFDGYDGKHSWRVRRGELAETREGLGAGGIPMPPMMADVPFSDLRGTLERIRVDYTVEAADAQTLPAWIEPLRYVRVRRNSRDVKGPETIEIWADAQSGLPRRIVFDRAKIQGNRQPCRLTFDLTGEKPLPGDWFTPAPHITGGGANP